MNDTTQKIATEAWWELHKVIRTIEDNATDDDGIAIIQSAIEKATESLETDLALAKQMVVIESNRANRAESHAAHTSDQTRRVDELVAMTDALIGKPAHASEQGDSEWECPDCHTRKSDLRLADATSQALRHQLLQSRPAHEEPWDLLAEAIETLNPATSLYKDIKHALSQRPTPATASEPCVYKGDCGLCERCGKPMSDYKHTRAAHASEPVYHSCKLGECGVKLEPDIVAEAAETQVRSLEERGYLDFDSGEQEDRASVVAQLAAIIQSSIEKVRLESRDEIEELQRQLRIAHKWALLSDDISEDDATLQDTKRLDWLDDGHLSYINYNINGVMRTIPDPQGQGSARRSIDAAMEQA